MASPLRIDIHLIDGSVAKFVQDGAEEIGRILKGVTPARFFREPVLMIGGSYSVTVYHTGSITHLVFDHDALPNWADLNDESPLCEIDRDTFMAAARAPADQATPRIRETGNIIKTFARLGLRGGGKLYVAVETHLGARIEQRHLLQRFFQLPYYYIQRDSGSILLNTANLVGVSFFPGPPELPNTAWPMHHFHEPHDETTGTRRSGAA